MNYQMIAKAFNIFVLDKRFALVEKSKTHFYTVDPLNKFLEKFEF